MPRPRAALWIAGLLLVSRLAHRQILWADEDYHLAAAVQLLHGKIPYRDFWYDKPPLTALAALLFGGWYGVPLRIAGTVVALAACFAAFRLASALWSEREGLAAVALLAFFQICYAPSAILPFEPDTLMIAPHLAAVYLAWRGRFLWAGAMGGVAFLLSPKGLLVVAAAALFVRGWRQAAPRLAAGFAIPCAAVALWLGAEGAFGGYLEQVWRWGLLYASSPGSDPQAQRGWAAVAGWLGFHAALVVGAVFLWWRERGSLRWRLLAWAAVAFASILPGWRFAPRYFDAVLAVLVIAAARGLTLLPASCRAIVVGITLLIPAVRFGPRYFSLAWEDLRGIPHAWQDVAMDQESRQVGNWLLHEAKPGDTVFVWGYRPNVIAYSRLPVVSRFWDSQPVTGVPADRHLSDARPVAPEWAAQNRQELTRSRPSFLVDGLSAYNPALDIHRFDDLSAWLRQYCEGVRVGATTVYRRCR